MMKLIDAFLHGREFSELCTEYIDSNSESTLENLRENLRQYKRHISSFSGFLVETLGMGCFIDVRALNPFSRYYREKGKIGSLL